MAHDRPSSSGQGRGGVQITGAGWLIILVILVFAGMMLFGDKGEKPETADSGGAGLPPTSGQQEAANSAGEQKRTSKGEWSIEEVASGRPETSTPSAPATSRTPESKVTKKGDWVIEEVPTGDVLTSGAELKLETIPGTARAGEGKVTKKGDWSLEELKTNTRPAGELKLTDPKDPKTTKKGDWELKVD